MMGELISIIVPVYNVAPYLEECVLSLVRQTYQTLEIILVDDGSSDGSGRICEELARTDNRIRVIHQKNAGVSAARNTGVTVCTGDLITFVDSDDWIDSKMLEKLYSCLKENQAEAAMCGFVDYPHGAPVEKGVFSVSPCDFQGVVYQMMRRNGYFTALWAKLFRRELVFREGAFHSFDTSLAFGEDEVWILEVLHDCKRVAFLHQALYYWRPREGSVTRSESVTEQQMSIFKAKKRHFSLLPDNASILRLARGRFYNDCFFLKVRAYVSGNYKTLRIVDREIRSAWWDWICSRDVPLLRKIKVILMEAEILFHMPVGLVQKTDAMTHPANKSQRKG